MKAAKLSLFIFTALILFSCGSGDSGVKFPLKDREITETFIPVDKGFDEYISSYTSGIIPVNSSVEIRFTPEFAARAKKQSTSGLIVFNPAIKGRSEWADETTLVFRPARLLDAGQTYTGVLNLSMLTDVPERLKSFPLRIQTLKKDFRVTIGALECPAADEDIYQLRGKIVTSDFIEASEVEKYLTAKLGRKKMPVTWDHSESLNHNFTISDINRTGEAQELIVTWDGSGKGVRQKGSYPVSVPPAGEFSVLDILTNGGAGQKIDIIFSDPVDVEQETEGLIWLNPANEFTLSKNSNIISLTPSGNLQGAVELVVEQSVKSKKGSTLATTFSKQIDFTSVLPGIELSGNGVILPSSENLIFPFKAANLKAVDLKIIKIFENNLPYFLQENDINSGYYIKRFGRPVYSGRVDLVSGTASNTGAWNLYTIDLADYIDVEPGVLYKVRLGMRKSYSTYQCGNIAEESRYEQLLQLAEEQSRELWSDEDNYYEDTQDAVYYSFGFEWSDRDDPCKEAYYSPDRSVSRNILASNLGIIAKRGDDKVLHVMVSDLLSAMPVSEVSTEVYDYQMQLITSGNTDRDGALALPCDRLPFLIIAKKDKDRNYLKINDGAALSVSSFDVSGSRPENGIKAFVYGERDVWRPGDSIYLSLIIRDIIKELPAGHPVQFELMNPLEQRVDNQVQKINAGNLLVFKTKTTSEAITGDYRAQFRIGGALFTKRIRVESIKPNRLKINLDFPDEILGGSKGTGRGTLNVKWLNGSVAKNLKTSVEYLLKHTKTEFKNYGQYTFDDPAGEFTSETVNILDGEIDDNGNATVNFDPGPGLNAPGMLSALFTTKVSEQGGDESITQTTLKYAPYPVFVGINLPGLEGKSRMLFTDRDNEVKVVTLDESGKQVRSEVELTVYKISYRWWWESDEENLAYFISNNIYKPVIKETITTKGGEGSFTFKVDKNQWGRYLIRATTPGGHSTGKILLIDWPWEYGMKGDAEGATLLSVSTNKEKYNVGDDIELSFPAPENARAIVTIENSAGVMEMIRVNTVKTNTVVKLKAKPEMAPNVYAWVTVIQPHSQTVNDMPVRLYGVVPIMVEDEDTRLAPVIEMADEIRSQKSFDVKISEENRKPMTYTLAVVDEGLLDITGFKTPDPWKYFYAREALGVKTWDLYDFVLGAFGGTLERLFAIGGDEALIDRSAGKARRFVPVVKFLGPFTLNGGKNNRHIITLPQYTGSVKVMVIAGSDRAFGVAEKSVFVKDPLMVLVTAPRVISPGEKAALPITLFVQKSSIKTVEVKAEVNGLLSIGEQSKNLQVSGEGEIDTEFSFVAGEKTGVGKIKVSASGGGETASSEFEIEVRSPNPPETRSELKILKPGEKWETSFKPFGIEGSNSARLDLSVLPSVNLEKRLYYLISYPYGCSEQITSAAFPQLWLKELSGNDSKITYQASENIKAAITLLATRQMANGGIALWPGAAQPDNWVTSYAGHFMTEAEKLGFSVPSGFKQKWIGYQKNVAREWKFDSKFKASSSDQAYRLLTLALAGEPDRGSMNRLRETKENPQLSRWLLAAAFATTGRTEVADDLLDIRITEPEPQQLHYNYGSMIRDKAIILYTLTLLKNEEAALPILKEICDNLNNDSWYSTQSVAWGLYAYMKWAAMLPNDSKNPVKINLIMNGEKSEHTIHQKQIIGKDIKLVAGNNNVIVENKSDQPVYANLTRKGTPIVSDPAREDKGLSLYVSYVNMDLKPVDQRNLVQGSDFMMIVNVTNNTFSKVDNIALNQMIPSGWEIQNTRMYEADYGVKEGEYDYRDIRDDRVNTFFSLNEGESKTFVLILNAAYKGEFFQPSIWCGAMYLDNCYSRYPGTPVKVTGEN